MSKKLLAKILRDKALNNYYIINKNAFEDLAYLKELLLYVKTYEDMDFLYETLFSYKAGVDLITSKMVNQELWFSVMYNGLNDFELFVTKLEDRRRMYGCYCGLLEIVLKSKRTPIDFLAKNINNEIPYKGYYFRSKDFCKALLHNRVDVHNLAEMGKYFDLYRPYPEALSNVVSGYLSNLTVNYDDVWALKGYNVVNSKNLYGYLAFHSTEDFDKKSKLLEHYNLKFTKERLGKMFVDYIDDNTRRDASKYLNKLSYLVED